MAKHLILKDLIYHKSLGIYLFVKFKVYLRKHAKSENKGIYGASESGDLVLCSTCSASYSVTPVNAGGHISSKKSSFFKVSNNYNKAAPYLKIITWRDSVSGAGGLKAIKQGRQKTLTGLKPGKE